MSKNKWVCLKRRHPQFHWIKTSVSPVFHGHALPYILAAQMILRWQGASNSRQTWAFARGRFRLVFFQNGFPSHHGILILKWSSMTCMILGVPARQEIFIHLIPKLSMRTLAIHIPVYPIKLVTMISIKLYHHLEELNHVKSTISPT